MATAATGWGLDQRAPRAAFRSLLFVLLMLAGAQVDAKVKIGGLRDFDLGTWNAGSGDLVAMQSICVETEARGRVEAWRARVDDRDGNSTGTAYLVAARKGSDLLEVSVRVRDVLGGAAESLRPGLASSLLSGAEKKCPSGDNLELEIRLSTAALGASQAGRFEGDLELVATSESSSKARKFRVRVDIPDLVRLSGLDDIALGHFPGAGDLVGSDAVCVYRNDPSARYELHASGQGAGSAFVLEQGPASVPFEVEYDDGSGFVPLAPEGPLAAAGAAPDSPACGGLSNGVVRVTVREADLMTAEAGAYGGTLTLTVAPL